MIENDLESFDIVLKLHTKAFCVRHIRKKGRSVYGFRWRDELVNSLLGTKGNFTDILGLFLRDPKAGMVCSDWLYIKLSKGLPEDLSRLKNELDRIGLANVGNRFCAGTMFMARTSAYMFLKTAEISADMFDPESDSGMIGSVAHVYERILSMAPVAAGYEYASYIIFSSQWKMRRMRLRRTGMSRVSGVSEGLLFFMVMPEVKRTEGMPWLMKTRWSERL